MLEYIEKLQQVLREREFPPNYVAICVQYAERLLDNKLPVIFDKTHLASLIGFDEKYLHQLYFFSDKLYQQIKIPKKNGTYRDISIPAEGLKYIQRWILDNILYKLSISEEATEFVPNRSIIDNAKKHINRDLVINMDIKNFFPTITIEQVYRIFNYYGYTKELSFILAKLCTFEGHLPQGAPTSPCISNIICLKLDKRFAKLAKSLIASYSRYADDITMSGGKFLFDYLDIFRNIIQQEGFCINEQKTRVSYQHQRQVVTGLIVNEKISIPRETKRYLRQQIHFSKQFGVNNHLKHIGMNRSNYKEYLYGLAYFIRMVEEGTGNKLISELDSIQWSY